jgi:hypothetical protein
VIEEHKVEDSPMGEATSLDPSPSKQTGLKSKSKKPEHVESRFDNQISDEDIYLVGKAYFNVKEYDCTMIALSPIKHGPGQFLVLKALFSLLCPPSICTIPVTVVYPLVFCVLSSMSSMYLIQCLF